MIIPQLFMLASAALLFLVVLNLVRQRRLREEYSWLWLGAALFYLVMALKPKFAESIADFFGITNPITAFVFFGLLFIVLILIEYSVALSKLNKQMKDVAQQIALLDGEQNKVIRLLEKKDRMISSNAGSVEVDKSIHQMVVEDKLSK